MFLIIGTAMGCDEEEQPTFNAQDYEVNVTLAEHLPTMHMLAVKQGAQISLTLGPEHDSPEGPCLTVSADSSLIAQYADQVLTLVESGGARYQRTVAEGVYQVECVHPRFSGGALDNATSATDVTLTLKDASGAAAMVVRDFSSPFSVKVSQSSAKPFSAGNVVTMELLPATLSLEAPYRPLNTSVYLRYAEPHQEWVGCDWVCDEDDYYESIPGTSAGAANIKRNVIQFTMPALAPSERGTIELTENAQAKASLNLFEAQVVSCEGPRSCRARMGPQTRYLANFSAPAS